MPQKFFPIRTDTACQLKWNWSTLFLNTGTTRSCCRTGESKLTPENFKDFHNTPVKLADRTSMLSGQWPEASCGYCRDIEQVGGVSDRMRHLTIPSLVPQELEVDPTAIRINPTIVEVYFSNACNLGCVYCSSQLSSTIEAEDRKFGTLTTENNFRDLVPYFWQWFPEGFPSVKRFHVLGGEPFYQLVSRKLARVDITVSVDCAGPQQEYVRWGFEWNQWRENFELLIRHRWLYLVINQTISALTIKTMPGFLEQFYAWRENRKIGHWFSGIYPDPSYMKAEIFGNLEFADTADAVLKLMPSLTQEDQTARDYMQGIFKHILTSQPNYNEIARLIVFLDEKDRRRGTHWPDLFPWLERYREHVVQ